MHFQAINLSSFSPQENNNNVGVYFLFGSNFYNEKSFISWWSTFNYKRKKMKQKNKKKLLHVKLN